MSKEHPSHAAEKSDDDRILQMQQDLWSLHSQILNIEDRLSYIFQRLEAADLYTLSRY